MSMLDDLQEMMRRLGPPPDRYEVIQSPLLPPGEVLLVNRSFLERETAKLFAVPDPVILYEPPTPAPTWLASLAMRFESPRLSPLSPMMTVVWDEGPPVHPDRSPGWRKRLRRRLTSIGVRNWRRFAGLQMRSWLRSQGRP
jgi:hypothetical protein